MLVVSSGGQGGYAMFEAAELSLDGALLVGGLASIVTSRMSFRFYVNPRAGHAGAAAIIAGAMQLIAGGLAAAAAHALATHTWKARLDALFVNPWPLLIPLSLLLICALGLAAFFYPVVLSERPPGGDDGAVCVWDLSTRRLVGMTDVGSGITHAVTPGVPSGPGGETVALFGDCDGMIHLVDLASVTVLRTFATGAGAVNALAAAGAAGGRTVVFTSGSDSAVRTFDLASSLTGPG